MAKAVCNCLIHAVLLLKSCKFGFVTNILNELCSQRARNACMKIKIAYLLFIKYKNVILVGSLLRHNIQGRR